MCAVDRPNTTPGARIRIECAYPVTGPAHAMLTGAQGGFVRPRPTARRNSAGSALPGQELVSDALLDLQGLQQRGRGLLGEARAEERDVHREFAVVGEH